MLNDQTYYINYGVYKLYFQWSLNFTMGMSLEKITENIQMSPRMSQYVIAKENETSKTTEEAW